MNPTAIEGHLKLVLVGWMVIIAVAWLLGRLGRRLGQPLAVGEILGGILLGPSLLGRVWPAGFSFLFPEETQQSLQLLAKIGLIFLLFQVGMEFDFGHLRTGSKTVTAISLAGIVAPAALGLAAGPWLHREFAPQTGFLGFQLFVCIAMAISALPIMGRILLEMNLERTRLGAISVSSAAIDDVVGWVGLAVIQALVMARFAWGPLALQVALILAFLLALQFVVGPALRALWRRMSGGQGMSRSYLAVLLLVLFGCCLATNRLGIFAIFGAFLLGVSLHQERGLVQAWRERFADFVIVALVPIFFTNTGLRTRIDSLTTPTAWLGCAVVMAAAVAGKLGGCYLGGRLTGVPGRMSACVAALMNTRALMGLVAINIGADLGYLPRELFTMFVIMALLTTAMTGPLLRLWLTPELRQP